MKRQPPIVATIEQKMSERLVCGIMHYFLDAWVVMIIVGTLGHQLDVHFLLRVGYWQLVLVIMAIQYAAPVANMSTLLVRKPKPS